MHPLRSQTGQASCRRPWRRVQSGHRHQLAVSGELPAVERAGDSVTADPTADAQVGAEVRAVRIEDPGDPVVTTEEHEVLSEVGHRSHIARRQVRTRSRR